jgi:major intracellular serine protease
MKVRFLKNTNIRLQPSTNANEPIGMVYANTTLEVEDQLIDGVSMDHPTQWFRDFNGWYYFSGSAEQIKPKIVAPPLPLPILQPPPTVFVQEETTIQSSPANPIFLPIPEEEFIAGVPQGETRLPNSSSQSREIPAIVANNSEFEVFRSIPEPSSFETFNALTATVKIETSPAFIPPPTNNLTSTIEPLLTKENIKTNWQTPVAGRSNWAIEGYSLDQEWWKKRNLTGKGIRIAILSTGAALNHPDLEGAVQLIFDTTEATPSSVPRPPSAVHRQPSDDEDGLGTQAAVLAAGRGNICFGIAPEATLLIGKLGAFDRNITPESLLAGVEWAINAKADVIALLVDFRELNASQRENLQNVVQKALANNIILLAPVGNSIERKPENRFPASFEGVIAVGAHDMYGKRSPFSAKSHQLDILAPGEDLLTSDMNQKPIKNQKNTALATAFVAGFVALVKQWEMQNNRSSTPDDFLARLRESAIAHQLLTKGNDVEYGFGLLNPIGLLEILEPINH